MSHLPQNKRELYDKTLIIRANLTQNGGVVDAGNAIDANMKKSEIQKLLIPPQPADIYDTVFETPETVDQPLPHIPKILHHIWLGKGGIPVNYLKYYETARRCNPAWKLWLWGDEEIAWLNLRNRREFLNATEYAQKSDIARYEILYRYGGVYSDSDNEFVNSLNKITPVADFFASYTDEKRREITNSFMGAVRKSPVMACAIQELPKTMRDEYKIVA